MKARTPQRSRLWWTIVALAMPVVVVGSLLGLTSSADTALERIPVALVNNDELVETTNDDGEEEIILASKPLITELVSGDGTEVEWVITSTEAANTLLAAGEVYAIFEIPADFSAAVSTLGGSNPEQAQFTVRTDPSRSYLAGVLGDQVGDSIARALSVEFAEAATEGLFTVIVDLGDAFEEAADAATELAEGTEEFAEGMSELAAEMPDLDDGASDLASGYATFDDGLGDYADGVTALSDGLDALSAGTSGLGALSSGISDYTAGVSTLSATLSSLNAYISGLDPSVGKSTLQAVEQNLALTAAGGATLSTQTSEALSGLTTGIIGVDKGADALDTSGQKLADASNEFRDATADFAEGISGLADGIGELDSAATEIAEGTAEFAEGLSDGAEELSENDISVPSESALEALVSPVVFDAQDRGDAVGVQPTLASVIIPLGLWLVMLVTMVMSPPLTALSLTGNRGPRALTWRSLKPLLGLGLLQGLIALALLHTLGGAEWGTVGVTSVVVGAGIFAYLSLHFLLWVWRPTWVPAVSIAAAVIQIASVGSLVPTEVFPAPYRVLEGLTPLAWFTDALLAAVAGGDGARIAAGAVSLVALSGIALVASILAMKNRQDVALNEQLGVAERLTAR